MKKKFILSIAAAAAILAVNPITDKADAASIYPTGEAKVIYYQNGNLNQEQINNLLKKLFANSPALWNQVKSPANQNQVQQPVPQTEAKPAQNTAKQATAPAPAAEQTQEAANTASQISAYEKKVIDLTNQERAKNGLKPLTLDTELSKVAREKSKDMQAKGYFSHTSPTYGSPFDMMKKFGISYKAAGENIAMGQKTPEEVVQAWMNSEGHRKNILNANFTHIGVGHVAEGNYWTQMFIGK
ncbi:CAP domain-containing protein [Mesobacillus foraminis]|uniref:Putative YkwD family protein n=1 Tax=Mesobacillus foraminis TaxID=279826 RepID=A0A4R2BDQ0_9BACI|nr:CAP domain-containing protein [Mesobacillus foraminis]TCN24856.1 putative YkwD family protein [Mesobacillus foraminis]